MKFVFFILGVFFLPVLATAQILSTFVREQVASLPKGRIMVSLINVSSSIDNAFDRSGNRRPLAQNFDQNVSFRKITQEEKIRGNQLAGLFLSNGLNLDDSAAQTSGRLSGVVSGKIPVIAYGITDDVMMIVSVPILEFQINSAYQVQPSSQTRQFLKKLESNDQKSVSREFDVALHTSLENKLYRTQYDWNPALNRTYLGDIQVSAMKVYDHVHHGLKVSAQPILILPTSTDQDIRDVYGLRAGDRRLGIGMKGAIQKILGAGFQVNASAMGTYLFANTQARHLPSSDDDELRELFDPSVGISGGHKLQSQAQLRYEFPSWVGLNCGLIWQKKFSETYAGQLWDANAYQLGGDRSQYELISTYASLDINSIKSFLNGGFLIPLAAEIGVGFPIRGLNALAEPVLQLQGTLFF